MVDASESFDQANLPPTPEESPAQRNPQLDSSALKSPVKSQVWKQKVMAVVEDWRMVVWMTILTVYALFGDDIRLAATDKPADPYFFSCATVCMFFFGLEIVLMSLCKEGYWLSFFFYLDFISTVSLITDIGWVWELIIGTSSNSGGTNASKASQVARASRASRAGTRAARVIRIIRVIRLIRMIKLYKAAQEARLQRSDRDMSKPLLRSRVSYRGNDLPSFDFIANSTIAMQFIEDDSNVGESYDFLKNLSEQNSQRDTGFLMSISNLKEHEESHEDEEDKNVPEESKVGKKLSEMTIIRVIMVAMAMIICIPLLDSTLWLEQNNSYQFGLEVINDFIGQPEEFMRAWEFYISEHKGLDNPLIYAQIGHLKVFRTNTTIDDLRVVEQQFATINEASTNYFYTSWAVFDIRAYSQLDSVLSILRTFFVCVVLSVASIMFMKDAEDLVIGPIESMVTKIRGISEDPLRAIKKEEREQVLRKIALEENPALRKVEKKKTDKEGPMETAMLEDTIIKIGTLLALGFGEAGSEIIVTNIKRGGGEVDPMVPGKKTYCIFGFCDIRNFTDATEELQEEVMVFVNEIAAIVHSTVDHFSGAANKNIGDAFLLVWKFPDELITEEKGQVSVIENPFVNQLTDMALLSFLKIIAYINKDTTILKYRKNPRLCSRIPNYSVKMGFGLHVGWAIEGAIGSEYKIDASYLSPNVNLASRLEAATKQYGVPLLVSGQIFGLLSENTKSHLRRIDRVTVKGSKQPLDFYTCDLDTSKLPETRPPEITDKKEARVMAMIDRERLRDKAWKNQYIISDLFTDDEDLISMRSTAKPEFYRLFEQGMLRYTDGNWQEARRRFNEAVEVKGEPDGPSETLLRFMEDHDFVPPDGWDGFRELTEK